MNIPIQPGLPDHIRPGVERYIQHGIKPGGFLCAVISNDLREAIGSADHICLSQLGSIVSWFYNYAPSVCWGSREKLDAWVFKFKPPDMASYRLRHDLETEQRGRDSEMVDTINRKD